MYLTFSLLMALAPSIGLLIYFYKQDRKKPEPIGLITRIFFLGIVFTIPACLIEIMSDKIFFRLNGSTALYNFLKAFMVAAFVEELIKLIIVKKFVYKNPHFDEVMDGIVYTIVASLGFAFMENLIYVIDGGIEVAVARAFTAVPMHAVASGIMGYYIGKAKFSENRKKENALIYKGLWFAIFIHGTYNFLLFESPEISLILTLAIFPLIILTFVKLKEKIKIAIAEDLHEGRH